MSDEESQSEDGAGDRTVSPDRGIAAHTMICPACSATYAPATRFCPLDGSVLRPIVNEGGDLVGNILDERYCLLSKLGQGGMGEVYLGEHVLTRRRCAVKVVSPILAADPDAFGRFIREATNAGRINHPHVATIYDFGKTDDGLLYLAMEYVEGEPLSALLEREDALPPARAVEIAQQVAEAVAAAHELGIVHRDLKPGNILVARDRKGGDLVKVVDFGIARTADEQQHLTRTGFVIGTPEYMSPEQLIGDPVDARTDIYALGCILYQMLTGQHAFGGSTARLITRRLTERPPRPRELNHAIPKALDEVIVTALGRTPAERFQTMEELREALLAAPAQPVTTGPRRLAAWLGLTAGREQRDPDTGAAAMGHRRIEEEATRTRSATAASPAPELAELSAGSTVSAEFGASPLLSDHDGGGDGGAAYDASFSSAFAEPDADPPRRSLLPKVAIGAAAVVALVVAVAALRPGEPDVEPAPPPTAPEPGLTAPAPAPDSTLAELRSHLETAENEIVAEQYVDAIKRLRAVQSSLDSLAVMYPQLADVPILTDSANAQLDKVARRCAAHKKYAAARNEPLPVCEVS